MELSHLCSRNENPTVSDRQKQIHLLRYLKGCPNDGPVFSAAKGPIKILVNSDAAHAAHAIHSDGSSHSGNTLSVGKDNASFFVTSVAECSCTSPDSCSAEYTSMSRAVKKAIYFRQLAEDLAFPQDKPTIIEADNQSAINLTVAPAISRKSRHIFIKHHFIRSLFQNKVIAPVHVGTQHMSSDMLTKQLSTNKFLYDKSLLFNTTQRKDNSAPPESS